MIQLLDDLVLGAILGDILNAILDLINDILAGNLITIYSPPRGAAAPLRGPPHSARRAQNRMLRSKPAQRMPSSQPALRNG